MTNSPAATPRRLATRPSLRRVADPSASPSAEPGADAPEPHPDQDAEPAPDSPVTPPPPIGGGVPTLAAVGLAIAGGLAMLGSFPMLNAWWLAPIAVALIMMAVHRRTFWGGLRLGGLAGLVFFVPLLYWTHIVGGLAPWLILSVAESVYIALACAGAAYASPLFDRQRWLWPVATGLLWVAQEAARDRWPFGGFPWGRLAFSQADSPALRFAALGGAPLVTFAVALSGGVLALAGWRVIDAGRARHAVDAAPAADATPSEPAAASAGPARRGLALTATLVVIGIALVPLGFAVPLHAPAGRAVQVAIVQGNVPRLGLDFNSQRRAVLDNHVRATMALAAQVAAGQRPRPDLVIWPENSSDIDPLVADDPGNSDAAAEITQAANTIGAPILVGAVLEGPGTNDRNAAIVWLPGPNGGPQTGEHGLYVKQHPVPFAEYIPLRGLARMVSKRVDLVVHDFVAGNKPGVLNVGGVTVGDAICFEVAYDNIVRDTVTGGAQLLTVQTNNADFDVAEASQQLAMVRLRAVEHGRDSLMVSTVGISGFVDASGGVHNATGFNVVATELRDLRLGGQRTLATELGPVPEFVASGLAIGILLGAVWLRHRIRSGGRRSGPTPTTGHKVTAA